MEIAEVKEALNRVRAYVDAVPTLYDEDNPMHPKLVIDTATNWHVMGLFNGHKIVETHPQYDLTYEDLKTLLAAAGG